MPDIYISDDGDATVDLQKYTETYEQRIKKLEIERDALRELLDTTQTAAELLAAQRDVLQDAVKAAWFCLDNIAMYYSPSEEDERQFQHWYDTAWAALNRARAAMHEAQNDA